MGIVQQMKLLREQELWSAKRTSAAGARALIDGALPKYKRLFLMDGRRHDDFYELHQRMLCMEENFNRHPDVLTDSSSRGQAVTPASAVGTSALQPRRAAKPLAQVNAIDSGDHNAGTEGYRG